MDWPAVTVFFRTYNRQSYAEDAFRALVTQDYRGPITFLIGDSTPKSRYKNSLMEIAERAGRAGQVKWISFEQPLGEVGTTNALAPHIDTDWVLGADDDDLPERQRLRRLMETALSGRDIWQVYSDTDFIDSDGQRIQALRSDWFDLGTDRFDSFVEYGRVPGAKIGLSLYRKSVFDLAGSCPENLIHSDLPLSAAAIMGGQVVALKETLLHSRLHGDNHCFGAAARKSLRYVKHLAMVEWLEEFAGRIKAHDHLLATKANMLITSSQRKSRELRQLIAEEAA